MYPPLAEQPPRAVMLRLSSAQKLFAPSAIVRDFGVSETARQIEKASLTYTPPEPQAHR